jgi:non-specific serine/threonine protein kinase
VDDVLLSSQHPTSGSEPVRLRAVATDEVQPEIRAALVRHPLPAPITALVGRADEVAAIQGLLVRDGVRLLTLIGPGGVGKTRLALAAAAEIEHEFPDGAAFVPLAAVRDPAHVLPAIAQALDARESPERPLAETLVTVLQHRRLLLVLDNFEQVAAAAADLAHLLAACPRLTALVTSRAALKVGGERRFATLPLAVPPPGAPLAGDAPLAAEAVTLFVQRARQVQPDFAVNAHNAAAVAETCRRLEGLPLAIELAAAWIRVLPPAALLERLAQRLLLLRGGGEDQPARLRTMRDAIAWSYGLLTPDEARLLRRLAVFVGGFTLEAAEAVSIALHELEHEAKGETREAGGVRPARAHPAAVPEVHRTPLAYTEVSAPAPGHPPRSPDSTLDLLSGLIDKSIIQRLPGTDEESRYQMLEVVREYALEQLAESGEAAAAQAAQTAYVLALAERLEPVLLGPEERRWLGRCDAELGNVRAALSWALEHDPETALRIGSALGPYWSWFWIAEGKQWLARALALPPPASPSSRYKALSAHSALATLAGDLPTAFETGEAALVMAQDAGDTTLEALIRWNLGAANYYAGNVAAFDAHLDRALALWGIPPTPMMRAWAAYAQAHQGANALLRGDIQHGIALYEKSLARARGSGSDGITLLILGDYAGWLIDLGDTGLARSLLDEALTIAATHRGRWLAGAVLIGLALADAVEGQAVIAARGLGAVETIREIAGLFVPIHYQRRLDRATALARAALGDAAFAREFATGRADPDAAVAASRAPAPVGTVPGGHAPADGRGLTSREREVLGQLVLGQSDKEIAAALSISRHTASKHVAAVLVKLGVESRTAAVATALRDGLV